MKCELRWIASSSTSALRLAWLLIRRQPLTDLRIAAELSHVAAHLKAAIAAAPIEAEIFWSHLLPQSAGIENNRELIKVSLMKSGGQGAVEEGLVSRIAGAVADVENKLRRELPNLAEDLALRGRVLRENWEAGGQGFLNRLAETTENKLVASAAQVVLVHPVQGGGGEADIRYNSVRFEAVLANSRADLPEPARLGWLLGQLNLDLPELNQTISSSRLPRIGALAMLPAALHAAEHVEWLKNDAPMLAEALSYWLPHEANPHAIAELLSSWWQAYLTARPGWAVAIGSLDKLLNLNVA